MAKVKIKVTQSLSGEPFLLARTVGAVYEFEEKQAKLIVECGRGEYVDAPKRSKSDKAADAEILSNAKKEAEEIVKAAREAGEKEAAAIVETAKTEAAEILDAAKKEAEALKAAPAPDAPGAPAPEKATDKKAESAEQR